MVIESKITQPNFMIQVPFSSAEELYLLLYKIYITLSARNLLKLHRSAFSGTPGIRGFCYIRPLFITRFHCTHSPACSFSHKYIHMHTLTNMIDACTNTHTHTNIISIHTQFIASSIYHLTNNNNNNNETFLCNA